MDTARYKFQISELPASSLNLRAASTKMQTSSLGKRFVGASSNPIDGDFILHFAGELDEAEVESLRDEVRSWDFTPLPPEEGEENVQGDING